MLEQYSTPLRVPTWNRQTSDALSRRDRRALRTLHASVAWTINAMQGRELSEAKALLARIEAGLRYLGGRRHAR
ncbi:hypothetical protein [Thiocapsa sp. UBA6158]|uniref:hypothetical protein n=1 Tax=Thiocapsa sp. UBA6158 TaxID=1947692 RepID=UPI0025EC43CA|nr:hypothetical protein [Thiocapsa sp. UBA6158]